MALVHPFQAHRFDARKAGDLDAVMTQPYDKIPEALQQEYYRRSPHNFVRVTRNQEKNQDPETTYPDAGATLERWMADGVLCRDPQPSIYGYYQDYEIEGERKTQKGFGALLDLKHSASTTRPHERTLAEPKMDRLRLMRRTQCNDDMIYMLYSDEQLVVNRILDETASHRPPDMQVRDDCGAVHRLWVISDPEQVKAIQEAMLPRELFIADGHHRFETSLNFMRECEAQGWSRAARESFDQRLVACFNSADQGTTILPTHRLVRDVGGFRSQDLLEMARDYFEVEECGTAEGLWQRMKQGRQVNHVFGFYPADLRRFYLLSLREEAALDPLMLAYPDAYRHLDVSILHVLVLDRLLGIDESKLVAQQHVDYARDRQECIRSVSEGKYQAAFFLNPTTVAQMQRIATLGERMPQKSTDFYPKLLSGLLLMKMRIER